MLARNAFGYVLGAIALVASCGGESSDGETDGATPTGGVSPRGGSSPVAGSSGAAAKPGGAAGVGGSGSGGRSGSTGGTVNEAGAGDAPGGGGSSGGSPSGSTDAGATGDPGGGGDGPSPEELDQYRACTEYVTAQCRRRSACSPSTPESSCLAYGLARCPDFLFSPGSRLSVAVVDGCTEAWQGAECDDLNRGLFPDCGYPEGTIETGSACAFSSQCATLACGRFGEDDCGVCLPILEPGDPCASAQGACPAGTECTGTCESSLQFNLPAGTACEVVAQCESGHVCRANAQGGRTCQPLFRIGETCAASWECAEGYCDADSGQCTASAAIGMACPEDGWGHVRSCASNAFCDEGLAPATCAARAGVTEPCWLREGVVDDRGNCEGELRCSCTDENCGERRCRFERKAGEECGDTEAACITGTECRAGVCTPVGARGLFEDACRP